MVEFEIFYKDDFNAKYNFAYAEFPSAYLLDKSGFEILTPQDGKHTLKSIDEYKK
ncbi:MAG: hypothetical protein ACFFCE_14355 [Promethearchaeota archaeon]